MEMACAELSGNGTQGSDDAKHPFPCALHLLYTMQSHDTQLTSKKHPDWDVC